MQFDDIIGKVWALFSAHSVFPDGSGTAGKPAHNMREPRPMKRSRNKLYQFVVAACLPISLTAQAQFSVPIVTSAKARGEPAGRADLHQHGQRRENPGNTIMNFSALADFVSSLHIAEASVNTNIYMRGIGSGNNRGWQS